MCIYNISKSKEKQYNAMFLRVHKVFIMLSRKEVTDMKIKATDNFTAIRIRKGYSVNSLAERMEVNPSVVYRIEQGKSTRPATAKKVCEALKEPFNKLFKVQN